MNSRASAPRTRASAAVRRLAGCLLLLGAIGALIAVQGSAHVTRPPAPAALDVQPFPGTPDASPGTHISFPALAPSQLLTVTVTASRSGRHAGRLVAAPDGRGTDFIPDRPFVNGDRVSVLAKLRSPAAGIASEAGASSRIGFSFAVAASRPVIGLSQSGEPAIAGGEVIHATRHDIRDTSTWTHTFHSIGWIHPPIVWMSGTDPDPRSSGDVFTDVHRVFLQAGPLIFRPNSELVWFNPIPNQGAAFNTQVQRYQGQQVLTYWQGQVQSGHGSGEDVILNHHYQTVATVNAGNGYQADLHEFQILPNGDALITAYAAVPNVDLTSVGGSKNGTLLDSIIQEVNIATGHVDWEWHAYGHVSINETYLGKPRSGPYDFFHINSIQLLPNGNLLVAARDTWTVYEINMQTGKIPYNFGGKNSSFKFGPGANFEWEHHATMQPDGTMTLFDDGDGYYKSESQSRALRLWIHYKSHQLTQVHAYTHSPPLLAESQGSMQVLGDGYTFVGWGEQPYFSEYDRGNSTRQFFTMKYSPPMESYRAFRFGWWGQPSTPPNIATTPTSKGTTVYASWNGATTVASWRVLAGTSRSRLTAVGTFPDNFFECTMNVTSTAPYFAVQALGPGGGVRATSAVVARGSSG
jgi:Arylsulfotransferase (ASST)